MAKISTYPVISTPLPTDLLIGTDVADSNATKNFRIKDIVGTTNNYTLAITDEGAAVTPNCESINVVGPDLRATAVGTAVTLTSTGYNVQRITTAINKIQILSIGSGGPAIEICPAPGANKLLIPQGLLVQITGSVPYSGTAGGDMRLLTGGTASLADITSIFNSTTSKYFYYGGDWDTPDVGQTGLIDNNNITITAGSGGTITDPTGLADLSLNLTLFYQIFDI